MKRKHKITVLVIMVIIVIAGIFIIAHKYAPRNSGPPEKITIGIITSTTSAPIFIAEEKGYFRDEGLAADFKQYAVGKEAFKALFGGEVDIIPPAETPIVFESFDRADFCIVATYDRAVISKIFTNRDTGITSIADLRGKKIATPMGSNGPFVLSVELTKNGITDSAITSLDVKPIEIAAALKDKHFDAAVVWEPYIEESRQLLGDKFRMLSGDDIYRPSLSFIVTKKYTQSRAVIIERFLKAIDRAISFMAANKEETNNILAKALKMDKKAVAASLAESYWGLSLDQALLIALADQARWTIKNNMTKKSKVPDFFKLVYPGALKTVKPEAVAIL